MTKQDSPVGMSKLYRGGDDVDPRIVESDHRIANSLTLTSGLLRMQRHLSTDEAVRSAILSAEARVASIGTFHRYLYRHGGDERIDLADYLAEVLPELGSAIGIRCVLVVGAGGAVEVPGRVSKRLTMIINELVLNARKHGYGGRDGGCVTVELESDGDNLVRLKVADGGTGLPESFDPDDSDGLGMRLVFSLVGELGGSFSSHTDSGAQFSITFPAG